MFIHSKHCRRHTFLKMYTVLLCQNTIVGNVLTQFQKVKKVKLSIICSLMVRRPAVLETIKYSLHSGSIIPHHSYSNVLYLLELLVSHPSGVCRRLAESVKSLIFLSCVTMRCLQNGPNGLSSWLKTRSQESVDCPPRSKSFQTLQYFHPNIHFVSCPGLFGVLSTLWLVSSSPAEPFSPLPAGGAGSSLTSPFSC